MSHGHVPGVRCIVLVGFMAAGKSTVGRMLADRLGWDFIDFDDEIRHRTGQDAGALIRDRGEPALRALEAELTDSVAGREDVVLAPGGGWATRPELAGRLGPGTVRVWLRVAPEEAVRRAAGDGADRPLLGPPSGRLERVTALLRSRERYYAEAEIEVNVDGEQPRAVVDEIVRRLTLEREDDER